MRIGLVTAGVVAFGAAASSRVHAQQLATWTAGEPRREVPAAASNSLAVPRASLGGALRPLPLRPSAVPAGVTQADSLGARESRAETGALIGGLTGAVVGGVLFRHFVHRDGAVNNGTGSLGGTIVGAGLLGAVGALGGLLVGSAIH